MIRLSYRLTLVCCSLLGSISGCGQDEAVFSKPVTTDEQDGGETTSPTSVPPTPPTNPPTPPTPPSGSTTRLAAACTGDADCGAGLICLTAGGDDWLGGGAANGYCTAPCTGGDSATCTALTPGAQCIQTSDGDYCVLGCLPGTQNNPKCQGRQDVVCDMVTGSDTGSAFCRPMCRGDEDCGGRRCLLELGICVDSLTGEDPMGAGCDPTAAENSCASNFCAAGITDGTTTAGYCSGLCTFGAGGCGSTSALPEKAGDASCFPAFSGGGSGDLGMCIQTCNCDADCKADKYVCAKIPDAKELLGVEGFCFEFDLAIPTDSDVVLGVECIDRDGGGDAMSHADGGDASPSDASAADASPGVDADALTSEPTTLGSDGSATTEPAVDAAPDAE